MIDTEATTHRPRGRSLALLAALLAAAVLVLGAPTRANADGPAAGNDVSVALSMGERELTATIRRVTTVPGPLHVDLISHRGSPAGRIDMSVVATGTSTDPSAAAAAGLSTDRAWIDIGSVPGSYSTVVDVDRPGPWELVLDDGEIVARIPFLVPAQSTSPVELSVYLGFVGAGALLIVATGAALYSRRRAWAALPAGAAIACLAIAAHSALLSPAVPPPPSPGIAIGATIDNVRDPHRLTAMAQKDLSRPPVNILVSTDARFGERSRLDITFSDGASGRPVDDLIVHDGALVHLLMISPSGELLHLHPVRTGVGQYHAVVEFAETGTYALSAEVARQGGGVQHIRLPAGVLVHSPGQVPGGEELVEASVLSTTRAALTAVADGHEVEISASGLTAGDMTSLQVVTGERNDLQLWLGMLGHLVIAGPLPGVEPVSSEVMRAPVWSHAHSMGAMGEAVLSNDRPATGTPTSGGHDHDASLPLPADHGDDPGHVMITPPANGDSAPDETVAAYGPLVSYAFVFPEPGRYRVWVQFARDFAIVTIPLTLEIAEGEAGS